jgi:uncharacterized surface protein with fasciclin (FAS1) repeats
MINDATVTEPNVYAVNGIVHIIDKVLIYPGFVPPTTTTTTTAMDTSGTIPGLAEKTSDLSTLVTALKETGLVDTLAGKGPFTVFAPTNQAFAALPSAELQYLLNERDQLTKVLEYHVANGNVSSSQLKNGETIPTLEGEDVTVTIKGSSVMINDATVTTPNVYATNGVVHIIDKVLVPPGFSAPNIPALATTAKLGTLVQALTAAKLVGTLSGAGPFTVFAPTDAAFAALPEGVLSALLLPANIQTLQNVLKYHVVSGEDASSDLKDGSIKTLEGQDVNVTLSKDKVMINDATVTEPNVYAVNGIVHVIDKVLIYPGFVPPSMVVV